MKEINVGHYKNDNRSRYVYLGEARVKTIEMQQTEKRMIGLLDIVFEVPLDIHESCEFLIRLETKFEKINEFQDKFAIALKNPMPHPNLSDLFDKAVMGATPRKLMEKLIEESKKKN